MGRESLYMIGRLEAHLPEGERLVWNLTSGVDGFMNTESECTVTLWDE